MDFEYISDRNLFVFIKGRLKGRNTIQKKRLIDRGWYTVINRGRAGNSKTVLSDLGRRVLRENRELSE
jgi:hypothetical protein